jgi:hypothetical protein
LCAGSTCRSAFFLISDLEHRCARHKVAIVSGISAHWFAIRAHFGIFGADF